MNRPIPPDSPDQQRAYGERYATATRVALVAGVFCLALLVLLANNYVRGKSADPLDSNELRQLKAQLVERKKDAELKDKIRALDTQLRAAYFQRQARAIQGGWLLLAGGAVFFLALRIAAGYRPTPPQPPSAAEELAALARNAARSRWTVAALAAIVVGSGAALLAGPYGKPPTTAANAGDTPDPNIVGEPPTSDEEMARNWPRFRGPNGSGISPFPNVPTKWDVKTGEGILWKVALPLPGASSPVVWEKRIFLTGADETQREIYCVDADSGALLWKQTPTIPNSPKQPPKDGTKDTGLAACTPATDGRRVFAIFANGDLGAFDFNGKQLWGRGLGLPRNRYGHAQSLLTCGKLLIVPWDQAINGKLMALDSATGKTVWETPRPAECGWVTPIIAPAPGGPQIITAVNPKIIAYDLATGKDVWSVKGLEGDVASSPVFAKGMVYMASARALCFAIKVDGKGDVTKTHVLWTGEEGLPDTASPLTDGQFVWLLTSGGVLTCYDAASGKNLYEHDMLEGFYSSPSLACGKVILFGMQGSAFFVAPEKTYRELGKATLVVKAEGKEAEKKKGGDDEDGVFASPAFQDGRMYVRCKKQFYCIGGGGTKK